jgi:hypothetical protein
MASVKSSDASSTKSTGPAGSATSSTKPSPELVRNPRTGKMVRKTLLEAVEKDREEQQKIDWRKRRVY